MWSWGARWDRAGSQEFRRSFLQVAGRKVGFRGFEGLAGEAKEIMKNALDS